MQRSLIFRDFRDSSIELFSTTLWASEGLGSEETISRVSQIAGVKQMLGTSHQRIYEQANSGTTLRYGYSQSTLSRTQSCTVYSEFWIFHWHSNYLSVKSNIIFRKNHIWLGRSLLPVLIWTERAGPLIVPCKYLLINLNITFCLVMITSNCWLTAVTKVIEGLAGWGVDIQSYQLKNDKTRKQTPQPQTQTNPWVNRFAQAFFK